MKYLSGDNLVDYISERQARQVRAMVQSKGIQPRLAIINTNLENAPIQKYIKFKQLRAKELGIEVELHEIEQSGVSELIKKLSRDVSVHGIILQLPLKDPLQTEEILNLIPPEKDVDALGTDPLVEPATAQAILWLLAGYNIDLKNKEILIIGQGRLVGAPLTKILKEQDLTPMTLDENNYEKELKDALSEAEIIISATGSAKLIKPEMLKNGQVVVDAGTSEDGGEVVGDLDPVIYESKLDIKVTPTIGGLGPLTISCLFENLLQLIDRQALKIV